MTDGTSSEINRVNYIWDNLECPSKVGDTVYTVEQVIFLSSCEWTVTRIALDVHGWLVVMLT